MDEKIERYILDLIFATRYPENYQLEKLNPSLALGLPTWKYQQLPLQMYAFLNHRGYVIPEDVRAVIYDILRHRIGLTYEAEAKNSHRRFDFANYQPRRST